MRNEEKKRMNPERSPGWPRAVNFGFYGSCLLLLVVAAAMLCHASRMM